MKIPHTIMLSELYVIWVLTPKRSIIQKASWYLSYEDALQCDEIKKIRDYITFIESDWLPIAITKANAEYFAIGQGLPVSYTRRLMELFEKTELKQKESDNAE